jgi:hypothetical protein
MGTMTSVAQKPLRDMTLEERDALPEGAWEKLDYDIDDERNYIDFVIYAAAPLPVRPADEEVVIYEGATEYVMAFFMGALDTGMANDVANDLARFDGYRVLGIVVAANKS